MFCAHGFQENNCPHCMMGNRVRPKQLVELASKDLPMNVKSVHELLKEEASKDSNQGTNSDYYTTNQISHFGPQRLTRNLHLRDSAFNQDISLFQQRMEFVEEPEYEKMKKVVNNEGNLLDPKKKFLDPQ